VQINHGLFAVKIAMRYGKGIGLNNKNRYLKASGELLSYSIIQ